MLFRSSSVAVGYFGLILGAVFAGLVYVIIALIVLMVGVDWIDKLMPAVVIGPTVAIIGLSLAGNAVGDIVTGGVKNADGGAVADPLVALICGLVTLGVTMACSVYGKKFGKLIPFIFGILAGYVVAAILTAIGNAAGIDSIKVLSTEPYKVLVANGVGLSTFLTLPTFTFMTAFGAFSEGIDGGYILTIFAAYVPVAFVVFAEHIADHMLTKAYLVSSLG